MDPMKSSATSLDDKSVMYEGCGKEGPIRSVFMTEFHHEAGPKIRCQVPENGPDVLSKDTFMAVRDFIIPKPELARNSVTVNVLGHKICGYPIILRDEKYERNQFMFNVCFDCYPWSRTVQYEQVLVKLSEFLVDLELECEFLSDEANTHEVLALLERVYNGLNETGECTVKVRNLNLLRLKVVPNAPEPPSIFEWDVPILMVDVTSSLTPSKSGHDDWDLTTKKILPLINGVNHVSRIAADAGVEVNLVKVAVQNLAYHRVVQIVPIFMYGNEYCVTTSINTLRSDEDLKESFLEFIRWSADGKKPNFNEVYRMVCAFDRNTSVIDVCVNYKPRANLNVDERRLVQYLVHKKLLRRILKFPHYVPDGAGGPGLLGPANNGGVKGAASDLYPYFTGKCHFDEICCRAGLTVKQLTDMIEDDPNVFVLRC